MYVNVFFVNSFLFCGESRWCVPGRHCLLLEGATFVPASVTDVFTKVSPGDACKLILVFVFEMIPLRLLFGNGII